MILSRVDTFKVASHHANQANHVLDAASPTNWRMWAAFSPPNSTIRAAMFTGWVPIAHCTQHKQQLSSVSLSLSLTFIHSQIRLLSCTHVKIASTSTITTATLNKLRISLNLNTVCMFQSIDVALWPLNLHIFHSNTLSQLTFHTQIICFGIPDQNCNLIWYCPPISVARIHIFRMN